MKKCKQKTICTCGQKASLKDILFSKKLTVYAWECLYCKNVFKYEQRHLMLNEV